MKILLITDTHSESAGGAEKHFFTLKNALKKQAGLTVFSLGFGEKAESGPDFEIVKSSSSLPIRQWWRMFFSPAKYQELKQVIENFSPDIIHLHNVRTYTVSLLKAVMPYPVIQTVHDYTSICPTGWNVHNTLQVCPTGLNALCWREHQRGKNFLLYLAHLFAFYKRKTLLKKTVKKFMAPSPLLVTYLEKNNFKNAIYIPPFHPENSTIDRNNKKMNCFMYIGQLEKHKGIDILIDEFALACQHNQNLILKIAGKGSLKKSLEQKVQQLKLENNIFFCGWVNPQELFQECIALIFPSIGLEAFGLVMTEAMANARAIIGSDRGPTAWLIDDKKTGLLFNPFKQYDLAEKILLLAVDKQMAANLGNNGYEKLKTFMSNQEIVDAIIQQYEHLRLQDAS